jgi:hypothetical protein
MGHLKPPIAEQFPNEINFMGHLKPPLAEQFPNEIFFMGHLKPTIAEQFPVSLNLDLVKFWRKWQEVHGT